MKDKSEDYIRLERAYNTILSLEQKLESMEQMQVREPVAVIGVACKFPGMIDSPLDYYRMLSEGKHVIEDIPADRWNFDEYDLELKNRIYCQKGGFLSNPYQFDPLHFNISPIEAEFMDPQQRIFLESCWKAFEDAGYTPDKLNQVRCGVYAGVVSNDYYTYLDSIPHTPEPYEVIGNYNSMLSARIAYFLNLKGPAVTLDTACSSSMVAIHMACRAIQTGDSDIALAGGVTLYVTPRPYLLMCESMMLSKTGTSYAFDQRADGFVPGEGCGVVVLKALSKAITDGDQIYGIIRGSGINQDGKSNGITAPNALAQTELQLDVLNRIGLNPEKISYVEAHGTGTELGDPIEVAALTSAFAKLTDKKQYCALGSVKNNMGHLQAAAGVASLIKVLLGMKYGCLFPSINYENPNRHIDFHQTPFYVNTSLQKWVTVDNQPKIAAINSFGFSGTNAHLIIEEYIQEEIEVYENQDSTYFLPISAQNNETLKTYVRELVEFIQAHQSVAGINQKLRERVRGIVAGHLHIAVEEIDVGTDWELLGLETVELQCLLHELNDKLGISIAINELTNLKNITELTNKATQMSAEQDATHFLSNLSYTFQTGRQAMKIRHLFIFRSIEELLIQCESFLGGDQSIYPTLLSPEAEACRRAWESGEQKVHWESVHAGCQTMPKRISAPVYPFSKQLYKLDSKTKSTKGNGLTRLTESLRFEHCLPENVDGKDSHQVKQVEIVPGAYMLQLMIRAANEALGDNVNYIEQVHFKAPLYRNSTGTRVCVELQNQPDQSTHCLVHDIESAQQAYSIGQLRKKPNITVKYERRHSRLAPAIQTFNHDMWYLFVKEQGFDYGESYRTVQQVEVYKDEAVAVIASAMDFDESSDGDFGFDARLIDGAIQPVIALLQKDFPNHSVLLPNFIESLHIYRPLPRRFTTCLKRTNTLKDASNSWRCLIDLTVLDVENQVVLEIHHLAVRVVTESDDHEEVSNLMEFKRPLPEVLNANKASDSEDIEVPGQLEAIRYYLKQSLSDLLKISTDGIELEKAFPSYGMDSFLSLKWMSVLEKKFGKLPKTMLFEHFDIARLSIFLQAQYPEKFAPAPNEAVIKGTRSPAYTPESGRRGEERQAVRILEQDLSAHPEERSYVDAIITSYGMEGLAVARREIAPELFLGSRRESFFYLAEKEEVILAFLYQGPEERVEELANELVMFMSPQGKQVIFLLEQRLEKIGNRPIGAVEIGALQRLEALPVDLKGKKYRHLRYAISNFQKMGDCRVEEYRINSSSNTDQMIIDIIDEWCSTKQMVNPYIEKVKNQIIAKSFPSMYRFFLTYLNDKLENVVVITPVPSRGGYLMDVEAYRSDMPLGGIEYAIFRIYEQLLKEGAAFLSLGATFGVASDPEANSDSVWGDSLSELWEQGIFNGSGNYQFKNKFRTKNHPLLLQRFMDTVPPNLLDIILAIANPVGVPPQEDHFSKENNLALYDYNTLFIPQNKVAYDLLTDSWSELSWTKELATKNEARAQDGTYSELIQRLREFFPFPYLLPVTSGREAEAILFGALPKGKSIILQNVMFPTTVQHQLDNGFEPVEIPKRQLLEMDNHTDRAELDIEQLKELLLKGNTAYVALELENNAAGGASISIDHLREIRQLCTEYRTPLIIDATRMLENAVTISKQEPSTTANWSRTLEVAAEMLKCADYVVASLTKDYGSPIGGLIATLDIQTFQKMTASADLESKKLADAEQAILFHALADKSKIVEAAAKRMQLVYLLARRLKPIWPIVTPIGGHCLIIDTKKIEGLAEMKHSAQVFLNWLYLSTGIRGSVHCGGSNPRILNQMVRLAIPIGLDERAIDDIAERICAAWALEKSWNHLEVIHEDKGIYGAVKNTYRLTSCPTESVSSMPQSVEDDAGLVAIIGLSGRYPDAENLEQFWHNLTSGHDAIIEIQKDRWDSDLFYDPDRKQFGKNPCRWGGFLRDVDKFDPQFFQITPIEAEKMDPQQRLFLQSAWHAVEDAGYALSDLQNQTDNNVGVFAGATWSEYSYMADPYKGFYPEVNLGSIATRVSYHMGFQGPAMTVDTHCSSSLSAIYLAYESVKNGVCKAAIAGGVNLSLHPNKYQFAKFFLSPTGKCHSFGASGDGYVPGEGVGAVLLKPLKDAIAAKDHIYGVIRSLRMRHGGKTAGVHVPNPKSQAELIQETLEQARVHPETVSYVEAHGTGTDLGDPIEVEGLTQAYRIQTNKRQYCAIGSVKSNIGHTEAAAGISQLTKVLLQLKHKKLVPSLHSTTLNPNIEFEETPFYVQQELRDWPLTGHGNHPRRAGISSFGAGGVNCHCIIEEYSAIASANTPLDIEKKRRVFPLSAKTQEALVDYVRALQVYMLQYENEVSLTDIAFTMQIGREAFKERVVFLASSHKELAELCRLYLRGERTANILVCSNNEASYKGKIIDSGAEESIERAAVIWSNGGAINWSVCRGFLPGYRTPLPLYPFAKERYWAPLPDQVEEAENITRSHVSCSEEVISHEEAKGNTVLYKPIYTALRPLLKSNMHVHKGRIFVFGSDPEMLFHLRQHGYEPVLIEQGEQFRQISPERFVINSSIYGDYVALWEALLDNERGSRIEILYLWGHGIGEREWASYTKRLMHPLLHLCTSLNKYALKEPISLLYGYMSEGSKIDVFQSALLAFFRTIHLENHQLCFKVVDTGDRPHFYTRVLEELQDDCQSVMYIKYYEHQRTVLSYEEIPVDGEVLQENEVLRTGGVYLITGGLGGVGYMISQYLASVKQAKLVLTGRSPIDSSAAEKMARLEQLGATALYIQADISQKEKVQEVIHATKETFGAIHGILHCAGVLRDGYFVHKTTDQLDEVAAAKIPGTIYLDECTTTESLDFFCLFSSLSAVSGNIGQCDYSYSNGFMDQYAAYREGLRVDGRRVGQSISINWPLWVDGGMQIPDTKKELLYEQTGLEMLSTNDGINALVQAIQSGIPQVLVTLGDREKINNTLLGCSIQEVSSGIAPLLQEESDETEELELFVCGLIKEWITECTKLPAHKIDIRSRFEEYGLDSIMIEHLIIQLEQSFGKISPTLLFEYQTIVELAEFLAEHRAEAVQAYRMRDSRSRIGSLETAGHRNKVDIATKASLISTVTTPQEAATDDDEIAIIGVSGMYPKAKNINDFWRNLEQGVDCVNEVPSERWDWRQYYDQDPAEAHHGKIYCKWGGFLDNVDQFDPLLFQISPKEAETMDPQERLFLQCVWDLFESNGYTREGLARQFPKDKGADIGVYVGVTTNSYQLLGPEQWDKGSSVIPTSLPWSIPNRISYFYNFNGPSIPVDTACSSSLVAIHMACESLKNQDCKMAIAGGVNLYFHPSKYLAMCQLGMLSKTGKCHAFGEEADGFVPGEGIGAVLLKPLKQAQADGDEIWGVIKGTSINHGGRTNGYKVPSPHSQATLIKKVLEQAKLDPSTINYIEAHGTGTSLGDPIEIEGLTQAYKEFVSDNQHCAVGSVKSNIGHCESAAGIASLTKVLLQMKYKRLTPSLHADRLNRHIAFEDTPFMVQMESAAWKPVREGLPLRAAISSFGAGGVNAHMVVESYLSPEELNASSEYDANRYLSSTGRSGDYAFIYSARNKARLRESLEQHLEWLCMEREDINLADLSYTLLCCREEMEERVAFVASNKKSLIESLRSYLNDWDIPEGCAVFSGNKYDRNLAEPLLADGERKEKIKSIIANRELHQAVALWTSGESLEWSAWFEERQEKLRLPTYVPAQDSYWITSKEKQPLLCLTPNWSEFDKAEEAYEPGSLPERHIMLVATKEQAQYWPVLEASAENSSITKVYLSNRNCAVNRHEFEVDSTQGSPDFSIVTPLHDIDTIYFLCGINDDDHAYEQQQNEGALSLVSLMQSFYDNITLKVITSKSMQVPGYEEDCTNYLTSAVPGITRTIPLEFPTVKVLHIDLQAQDASGIAAELLLAMNEPYDGLYPYIAYREGKRYRRELVKTELNKSQAPVLKAHGTYLILGGTGGIGFELSKWLATRYGARLILLGSSTLNEDKQAQLDFLNRIGGGASYLEADLRDVGQTLQRVKEHVEHSGEIDGVIHSAADVENSLITKMTPEIYHRVVGIQASSCMLMKEMHLELGVNNFIICSSASSFFGSQGGANYSASNSLKDTFSTILAHKYPVHVRLINWGLWGQVGLGKAYDKVLQQKFRSVMPIQPKEGLKIFEQIINASTIQVIATTASDSFVRSETDYYGPRQSQASTLLTQTAVSPLITTSPDPAGSRKMRLIIWLRTIVAECLKLDSTLLHDRVHLGDYGMDSIIGTVILQRLAKKLSNLPSTLMYEYFTIDALANYLLDEHAEEVGRIWADVDADFEHALVKQETASPLTDHSESPQNTGQDIAIIGIAGVYPQAKELHELWLNLVDGRDCITEVPADRWNAAVYEQNGSIYCKWGGFVDQPDLFDPMFFQLSPKEAKGMDPQERMFLQVAAQTFANAGYSKASLNQQKVGVFVGITNNTYQLLGVEQWDRASNVDIPNSQIWSIPNRVSFFYNLTGPSMPVDTACSSSLTALHLACKSIRSGESGMALVGGVNLYLHPYKYSGLSQMKMLSPTGQCRAFSDEANGFVPGEGIGAVLIKPLDQALQDGDFIHGIVKSTAVNHGGRTNGYTVPNPNAQASLIEEALNKGNIDPRTITYVEAHGTGTVLGDPIEIAGLSSAFRKHTSDNQYCAIGSIKTNIGHLEAASGIVGLTKILLQMKHQTLVPTLHHEPVNTRIRFAESPFYLPKEVEVWNRPKIHVDGEDIMYPRRAAVSSFGAGGANAHAIIEEYLPKTHTDNERRNERNIVPLSAKSTEQLQDIANNLLADLKGKLASGEQNITLERVAYTLQLGRDPMEERLAIIAGSTEELLLKLDRVVSGTADMDVFIGKAQSSQAYDNDFLIVNLDHVNLEEVARAWVNGKLIQWESCYTAPLPVKLPLPASPFSLKSYWLNTAVTKYERVDKELNTSLLHPLLQRKKVVDQGMQYSGAFTGQERFISEHLVEERPVCPGAVFMEMAFKAARLSADHEMISIRNVTFMQPLIFDKGPIEVNLFFHNSSERAGFEIYSVSGNEEKLKHVQGEAVYRSIAEIPEEHRAIDLQGLMDHSASFDKAQIYGYYRRLGIDYGPVFQSVNKLYVRKRSILGELVPHDEVQATLEQYELHPILLDGALQCMIAYGMLDQEKGLELPFYVRELHIIRKDSPWKYVYITPSVRSEYAYDVTILNEMGEALVCLLDFTVRPLHAGAQEGQHLLSDKQSFTVAASQASLNSGQARSVSDHIKNSIALILEWNVDDIDEDVELGDYGFDSLSFTRLADQLNDDYHIALSPALFFQFSTIRKLANHLLESYSLGRSETIIERTEGEVAALQIERQELEDPTACVLPNDDTSYTEHSDNGDFPVAIIGMAGRLPQSATLEQFWEHLKAGRDLITEIPKERWDWREYYGDPIQEKNKTKAKWGGFLDDIDKFDARFFKIAAREAELMDPQQRGVLELAWQTVEHAGYSMNSLSGSKTGVFVGVAANTDYNELVNKDAEETEAYQATGVANSVLVNRLSYMFNWHGPSEPIDTACSSSLVALHRAVESLRSGECKMALAGGVQLILSPRGAISFSKSGMLSPDGRCKTFDESANGYVRSEGMGLVLLKPLKEAERSGDQIYGIIRGTALNHGGKGNSLTSPNPNAQAEVIIEAVKKAGIDIGTISYIETHGTGTQLGDPVEINGLKKAFEAMAIAQGRTSLPTHSCGLGSVKTNVGHMETAAGMASLFKVLLSLKHRELPPNVHYRKCNPQIHLEGSPFYIVDHLQKWENTSMSGGVQDGPLRAGISSFGFGGVNAHLILEEYIHDSEPVQSVVDDIDKEQLIVLSAKDSERLNDRAKQLADYLESSLSDSIDQVSYDVIKQELLKQMEEVLSISEEEIDLHGNVLDMGFDQVSLYQLMMKVEQHYGVKMQLEQILLQTPDELIHQLCREIGSESVLGSGEQTYLESIAYTLQLGRDAMEARACWIVSDRRQLIKQLRSYCSNQITQYAGRASRKGNEGRDVVESDVLQALVVRDYSRLAGLWTQGAKIDWHRLYEGKKTVPRITLPGYPFQKTAYWFRPNLALSPNQIAVNNAELLIEPSNRDNFDYRACLSEYYASFEDHVIGDSVILPGAMYFEIVHKVIQQRGQHEGYELVQLFWLTPYIYNSDSIESDLYVLWTEEKQGQFKIKISSFDESGQREHFQASVRWTSREQVGMSQPIPLILKRCGEIHDISVLYDRFKTKGLRYGSTYRTVVSLRHGHKEVIAELSLNDRLTEAWHCSPSMIDGAFQSVAVAGAWDDASGTYLPFSMKRASFYEPVPPFCYAYIREKGKSGSLMLFDLCLVHQDGRVIAEFEDFGLKRYTSPKQETAFLVPKWLLCSMEKENSETKNLIAIVDPSGKLKDSQLSNMEACWLQTDLTNRNELETLLVQMIPSNTSHVSMVIHFEQGEEADTAYMIYEAMQNLIQILTKRFYKLPVQFLCLYGSGNQYIAHRALAGLGRTAALENGYFAFRFLEYDDLNQVPLISEIKAQPVTGCTEIKYDLNGRLMRQLQEVRNSSANAQSKIRQNGTYIITGGNGGLGLLFAKYLLSKYRVNVVIVSRSGLSSTSMSQLEKAARHGGNIQHYKADISREDELEICLSQVNSDYGSVHGIFHFAGSLNDSLLFRKTMDDAKKVLSPKIIGIHNLDRWTRGQKLELFVVFSSITALAGNKGQADYAYANRYMDEFVRMRNRRDSLEGQICRSYTINWPLWEHGGMQVNDAIKERIQEDSGLEILQEHDGWDALEKILANGWEQTLPVRGNKERISQALESLQLMQQEVTKSEPTYTKAHESRPAITQQGVEKILLTDLQRMFSEVLKIDAEELDPEEDLEMYGFDSIMMVEVLSRIEAAYRVNMEPGAINEHKSLKTLSEYLLTIIDGAMLEVDSKPHLQAKSKEKDAVQPDSTKTGMEGQIAVIGMACRFPQSNSLEQYWSNILQEKDMITEVPKERWDVEQYYNPDRKRKDTTYSKWGGFLQDIEKFDAGYWGIPDEVALVMDPQHRLMLELVEELWNRAGYRSEEVRGRDIGVFIGGAESSYLKNNLDKVPSKSMKHIVVNTISNMMAARISDTYDLRGPSLTLDTACSSSLVSIHEACKQILDGTCDMAIAGGVQVLLDPIDHIGMSQAGVLSSEKQAYVFDERAQGIVIGEGAGVVLLKPLKKAVEDGDCIHTVIMGSAVNNDGHTMGLTTPNIEGQKRVIQQALRNSGVSPETISYYEAHGTGTLLGDPIEIRAATQSYREFTEKAQYCGVGSVKANMGHLLRAAGIGSFIKAALAVQNGILPKTIHCDKPHPRFQFEASPFYPVAESVPWEGIEGRRRSAISSFGFGGTNCHMIIENFDGEEFPEYTLQRQPLLLPKFQRKVYWLGRKAEEETEDFYLRILTQLQSGEITPEQALQMESLALKGESV